MLLNNACDFFVIFLVSKNSTNSITTHSIDKTLDLDEITIIRNILHADNYNTKSTTDFNKPHNRN